MAKGCKVCRYIFNNLVALDQLVNTAFGGDPDETISSRAGKQQDKAKWAKALCWLLNRLDFKHCQRSIEEDEGKNSV